MEFRSFLCERYELTHEDVRIDRCSSYSDIMQVVMRAALHKEIEVIERGEP
jgi:hypothetical protein